MVTVHMICGFAGSGKTTFAKRLAHETEAIRFSKDEWMANLYGISPSPDSFGEFEERISELSWEYIERLINLNIDCVLDFGFWNRAERDKTRQRIAEYGAKHILHFLDAPLDVMKQRVVDRSSKLSPDMSGLGLDYLWLDEDAFDMFLERFEGLGEDEPHNYVRSDG